MRQPVTVKVAPEELVMLRVLVRESMNEIRKEAREDKQPAPGKYVEEIQFHQDLLNKLES